LDRGELIALAVADSLRSVSVLRQRKATGFSQVFDAQKLAGLARTGPCRAARARATLCRRSGKSGF